MDLCLNSFVLIFLYITSISCDIRTTMEEDIEHTDYSKIHKYDPHKSLLARQKMHFHKNFPVSKTIIYPFKQLLEQLEKDVYHSMFTKLQKHLNETQKNSSKILKNRLLEAVWPEMTHLDKLPTTLNTSTFTHDKKLKVQRKIDNSLPDGTKGLKHIIQHVFQQLANRYKNNRQEGTGINTRIYKPGYCYVFGICSNIFCNCDTDDSE